MNATGQGTVDGMAGGHEAGPALEAVSTGSY